MTFKKIYYGVLIMPYYGVLIGSYYGVFKKILLWGGV